MADDATNRTLAIWAVADTLREWIERYGVPLALYVDWKNLYKRPATVKEQLRGEESFTQFGRMCEKLGIEIIAVCEPVFPTRATELALRTGPQPGTSVRRTAREDHHRISGPGSWSGGRSRRQQSRVSSPFQLRRS